MRSDSNPVVRTLSGSPYRNFHEFFSKNKIASQIFLINPARRTTIISEGGIRFTFFPFSLCDVFGNPVQEEVEIRLIELFSRSDMLRSARVTTSRDRLLETAGQLHIQASQNLLPLELSQAIKVEMPVNDALCNPLAMRLYAGSTSTTRPYSSGKGFDWEPLTDKPLKIKKINGKKYFSFELDRFHWFSCNYLFARRAGRTMVSARMIYPVRELDDKAAFLVFRDVNAVARLYPAGSKFTIFNVPVNMPASILTLGMEKGRLFYGMAEMDKTSSQLVNVQMYPVTEQELLGQLTNF
jgi:hypothetical protein